MASLEKSLFKPIVFPGLGWDKNASKANAFFCLAICFRISYRQVLGRFPNNIFLITGIGYLKYFSIDSDNFI